MYLVNLSIRQRQQGWDPVWNLQTISKKTQCCLRLISFINLGQCYFVSVSTKLQELRYNFKIVLIAIILDILFAFL